MATEGQSTEEVSGQAAFWILTSLAAAAVVLPSTSSRMIGRDIFGGTIDLVRCVPGVALLDGICDLVLLCESAYRVLEAPKSAEGLRRALPSVSVVSAKLMLSVFTLFPLAIKAFSLKGVPATQFCAFCFFFAASTRLLVDLCGLEPEERFVPPSDGDDPLSGGLELIALLLQFPFELWIWYKIAISVQLNLSEGFCTFITCFSLVCIILLAIQLIIWLLYMAFRRRIDISDTPHIVPVRVFWLYLAALPTIEKPDRHEDHQSKSEPTIPPVPVSMRTLNQAIATMICAILLSITVAKALSVIGKLVVSQLETTQPSGERPTDNLRRDTEEGKEEERPSVEHSGIRFGRLGVIADRWLMRRVSLESKADVTITVTVFNMITTVLYYLVYFDGTGTVNPGWTSIFG